MPSALIKTIRSKLHGIYVTDANLNYHGSITLDPEHCASAGIYPLEFVEIWNKNNGARLSTYVILGKPGSKCCILNGAAARLCQPGDEIIIATSHYCSPNELTKTTPKILTFNKQNEVQSILEYQVSLNPSNPNQYQFSIVESVGAQNHTDLHALEDIFD